MPLPSGNLHVEDRDIGLKGRDPGQSLCHRPGLAHDVEFGVRTQEINKSPPDDLVVIDEKDFHHSKALRRCCRDGRCTAHNTFRGSQINTEHAVSCSAALAGGPTSSMIPPPRSWPTTTS